MAMDLGYLTAARPCDIRALQWGKVDPERILMRQKKTGQRMEVSMTDDLASVLATARQRPILGLYVVATDRGKPVTRTRFAEAWRAAATAAGIADAQFRDIRAMGALAAKQGGLDYQALLGHTTRRQSERYIKGRQTLVAEPVRRKL
jgi:integrase